MNVSKEKSVSLWMSTKVLDEAPVLDKNCEVQPNAAPPRLRAQLAAIANQPFINGSAHGHRVHGSGFDQRVSKFTNLDQ